MTEDISKLPKWAQQKIIALESQVAVYKEQVDQFLGSEATFTSLSLGFLNDDRPIPDESEIRFRLSGKKYSCIEVSRDLSGNQIRIMGDRGLTVQPVASNVITVGLEG